MAEDKKCTLNVAETKHVDIGRGIVRIDADVLSQLQLNEGDYLLIKGKSEVVGKALANMPEDEGLDLIRMDSSLRSNAGTGLGDSVEITPVTVMEAKSIEVSPVQTEAEEQHSGRVFSGDPTSIFLEKLSGRVLVKGNHFNINVLGNSFPYVVTKSSPKRYVRITRNTKLTIKEGFVQPGDHKIPTITYDNIGGLGDEVTAIREMIEIPMKHPEVFERIGISPPKGVLLHGPPGTGKTLLARALANELDAHFRAINGPEIMSKYYGESEKQLREIFDEAENNAPAIVFIDEIDSIAPNREQVSGEAERRIVSQMLTLMDGLKSRGNVVVIGATNRPNAVDPALRRPGRFDREIPINPPTKDGRREILDVHTRGMPLDEDVSLDKVAELTHGFTGADLEVLVKEAAMKALKKDMTKLLERDDTIDTKVLESIKVKMGHFEEALHKVEPSAMREVLINKPNVHWSEIGGVGEAKQSLQEMVEMPLREPELFKEAGIKAPKGVLLTGPPGTGKTLLAKAVATESEANFISVKGPELISKWVGESEKAVREIFRKAKQVAPSVIFFDEFDSLASMRGSSVGSNVNDKVVNQLLTELDGIEELTGVSVIAATNRADLIDEALKRPGRLDSIIEISLPDEATREEILKIHTKDMPLAKQVDFTKLAKQMDGFSGALIEGACQRAGLQAIRCRQQNKGKISITQSMFEEQIRRIKKEREKMEA